MSHFAPSVPSRRFVTLTKAVFFGGALCGVFDLLFAFAYYGPRGATPLAIMQSIAGGLLGRATYQGGVNTAVLGVGLHFLISFLAAGTYVGASRRLPALLKHPIPCGLLFGLAVYFVMNLVVLPLSAYPTRAFPPPLAPYPLLAHMVGVGLPIALMARCFQPEQRCR